MSDERTRFANVVLPHLGDAYALARWIARNESDAEDIVQEACLRAFRGISGFGDVNARGWVLSIVRNTAYTWLKKHRDPKLVAVENVEDVADAATGWDQGPAAPDAGLIERADAARLEAAIGALPDEFRETLVLRELQGLDYRAIAEVTGVPIGTVMSRLARARRRLIALLREDDK
ncbi:MAG TPA: sigma-70 family RNA polymerase sigma factor [Xanthobacteraceae bacterium]|nr:sigma-70 family RNA polymerase sigma factor [Xanthobacteraceae bacterium]